MNDAKRDSRLMSIDKDRGVFRLARRAFTDPNIFAAERAAIFDKCWLYVGHESEVATPGKFQVRKVGGREVIFNRDVEGRVNAFLNVCPHRGARICLQQEGTAKSFYCYYHGWSFASNGALRILPNPESFPDDFNADGSANLISVPRLEHYRGLYFVCFDRDAISLDAYLGAAKPYIDLFLDQGSEGMEIVEGTQDYAVKANWKQLSENSIDGNHGQWLHSTYFDYIKRVTPQMAVAQSSGPKVIVGGSLDLGNGHAGVEFEGPPWGRACGKWTPLWGEDTKAEVEASYAKLVAHHGVEHANLVVNWSRNVLIFPNLAIVDSTGLVLRVVHPVDANSLHVSSYALAAKGESDKVRRMRLFGFNEFLGPAGFATPDDIETIEQCQRGYQLNGDIAPWSDLSKGGRSAENALDEEGNIRAFWLEWARRLGDEEAIAHLAEMRRTQGADRESVSA